MNQTKGTQSQTKDRSRARRLVVVPLATALIFSVAYGFWSTGSYPGGNGAAGATVVNQGATPTASAVGTTVTVNWAASTLATGQAVSGYIVKRYDVATLTSQTITSACTGTITATTCTESAVPNGQWVYSVTPKVATNWLGGESLKSNAVTTSSDVTAPTNSLTLSPMTGGAVKSGNTVYYRGTAAGSFKLTNAVSDAGSGPASSTTAALVGTSTGWTHTPSTVSSPAGGPYVSNTFAWGAGTSTSPTEAVTGRDVASNPAVTTLTFTNDSTAPTAGSITYADGPQPSRSVSVAFTTGTDAASGLGTRQLQRASATLASGTCGTFSSFANLGSNAPTSPYVDNTVTNGKCYKYQYLVTDLVGNVRTETSANVAKVDYAGAVGATSGAAGQWRLGEASNTLTSFDSFTGATNATLASRAGETGATWTQLVGTQQLSSQDRAFRNGTGYAAAYTSVTPASANYSVEADLVRRGGPLAGDSVGVMGRVNPAATAFYAARWTTGKTWELTEINGAPPTVLATSGVQADLPQDQPVRLRLEMTGNTPTTLNLYVDGVLKVSATDNAAPFTGAGKAGIVDGDYSGTANKTYATGVHLDNFQVSVSTYPRAVDSKGTNHGYYRNGVALGTTGALVGDTNTAASFDGVNDNVSVARQVSGDLSTEFWFNSTQGIGTAAGWDQGAALVSSEASGASDDFGVSLRSDGRIVAGVGAPNSSVLSASGGYNNGGWHQVVFTRTQSSGALRLYVDGLLAGSGTGHTRAVTGSANLSFGGSTLGTDYFLGTLDEIATYGSALSAATVADHYELATVSAPPLVTATVADLAYVENGTTALDSGLTVTDDDSSQLSSATVTMTTGYTNGQDALGFSDQNGITGNWTAGTGVLALTGNATVAQYQTALRSITYTNSSDAPNTTTRAFTVVTNDGTVEQQHREPEHHDHRGERRSGRLTRNSDHGQEHELRVRDRRLRHVRHAGRRGQLAPGREGHHLARRRIAEAQRRRGHDRPGRLRGEHQPPACWSSPRPTTRPARRTPRSASRLRTTAGPPTAASTSTPRPTR